MSGIRGARYEDPVVVTEHGRGGGDPFLSTFSMQIATRMAAVPNDWNVPTSGGSIGTNIRCMILVWLQQPAPFVGFTWGTRTPVLS